MNVISNVSEPFRSASESIIMSFHSKGTEISGCDQNKNKSETNCEPQCWMKGNRLCCNTSEKEIIRIIPEDSILSSADSDSLQSREYLFKTFTFDVEEKDPEIKKCIAFWKTTLAKNVKPVKCNLFKNSHCNEKVIKKKKQNVENKDEMWVDIYKELQRRRLDSLKLAKQQKPSACDRYIDEEQEKKQEAENIKDLNNWKSGGSRKLNSKIDIKAQVQRTLQVLKANKSSDSTTKPNENGIKSKNNSRNDIEKDISKENTAENDARKENTAENDASKENTAYRKSLNQGKQVDSPEADSTEKTKEEAPPVDDNPEEKSSETNESVAYLSTSRKDSQAIPENCSNTVIKQSICCKCGCDYEECVCAEVEDYVQETTKILIQESNGSCTCCLPGQCQCNTNLNEALSVIKCPCGCRFEECVCTDTVCSCGCKIEDCLCEDENRKEQCPCECGLEECICQQLFTNSCQCGSANCDCTMIEMLNAYLGTLNTPRKFSQAIPENYSNTVTTEVQTDEENLWSTMQTQGHYCIICGHFDCYCTEENGE